MRLEQITETELQEMLQRAQEIAQQRPALSHAEHEALLKAAEEVGIPREATLQALRERRLIPVEQPTSGDIVFAPSEDGGLYPATIISVEGASVSVRYLAGGAQAFAPDALVPASLTPGRKVQYQQRGVGWTAARVCRYDPATQTVWLTSPWDQHEKKVTLARLRLAPRKNLTAFESSTRLWKVGLICGVGGTLFGLVLDYFLRYVFRVL